jgi:hypothetical protein
MSTLDAGVLPVLLFELRQYHFQFCLDSDNLAIEVLRVSAYSEKSTDILKSEILIRAGGKCECVSACDHHKTGRCGIALLPELWSAREILPDGVGPHRGVSMREALCEACRVNPAIRNQLSDEAKRADPNWWYRRRPISGISTGPARSTDWE